MSEKMNKKLYKYLNIIPFVTFFIAILYYSKGVGLKGDDLLYLLRSSYNFILPEVRISSFKEVLQSAYFDYMCQDARFFSSIICMSILRFDLKLYQLINPIVLTVTFYIGLKTVNKDKEFDNLKTLIINSLSVLLFFSISPSLLEEAVFWITGSAFYSWTVLSAVLIVRLIYLKNPEPTVLNYFLWIIVVLRSSFSAENLSLSISTIMVITSVYYNFFKKDKDYFKGIRKVTFILFWIFNLIELTAPGSYNRAEQLDFSLIGTLISGLTFYIHSQYIAGSIIPITLIFTLLISFKKYKKILAYLGMIVVMPYVLLILAYVLPIDHQFIYDSLFLSLFVDPTNVFYFTGGQYLLKALVIGYYGFITLMVAGVSIYLFVKEQNDFLMLFVILSTITNLILIPLGGATERTAYVSEIFMIFTIALLFYNTSINKKECYAVFLVFILSSVMFYSKNTYLSVNVKVNTIRENIFESVKNNTYPDKVITIPKYRFTLLGNYDNYYSFGDKFLTYYLGVDESYSLDPVHRSEFGIQK